MEASLFPRFWRNDSQVQKFSISLVAGEHKARSLPTSEPCDAWCKQTAVDELMPLLHLTPGCPRFVAAGGTKAKTNIVKRNQQDQPASSDAR